MCRAVQCKKCGKTTWAGCGAHVDAVMRGVPEQARCKCQRATTAERSGLLNALWSMIKNV